MYAKVVCNPPLGQTTVVPGGTKQVRFTVVLETDEASDKAWEVALWSDVYKDGSSYWVTHHFEEAKQKDSMVSNVPSMLTEC